jgi:ubiquinone/menaquinone biosynthesis C-methylase UbiE
MNERDERRTYLPAAGHDWFLPLYDPFVKLLGGGRTHRALVDQASVRAGQRVLDVGCGTGTLVLLIKKLYPTAEVVGLDPDPKALGRAARKAERAGASVRLDRGFSDELPYADASFDVVFSSLMFHHLPAAEKETTLREIRRVLKPGGSLHLADFDGHDGGGHGLLTHLIHSRERLADNSEERILTLMREAGFVDPRKTGDRSMFFARLAYYHAPRP